MMKYNSIIKSSIVTEKSSFVKDKYNQYALYVSVDVTKHQIKRTIESLFSVKVASLNVMTVKPKLRRFKGIVGCKKRRKKVYFSLMDGQKLDIMSV